MVKCTKEGPLTATMQDIDLRAAQAAALRAIDDAAGDLIALSKFIHDNPEIALQEVRSSAACADFLEERGFTVERGVAELPTAFAAAAGTGKPRIAYLSEYDALPGVGHGCGHNLIAMAGIGAGLGLAAALPHLGGLGRVDVFGTPAEEAVGGKVIMANAGVFAGVDAALGAHPGRPRQPVRRSRGAVNPWPACWSGSAFTGERPTPPPILSMASTR